MTMVRDGSIGVDGTAIQARSHGKVRKLTAGFPLDE
jgi:hypothetical protein